MIKNKTAIVTGGSKGLGRELIGILAGEGFKIATIARSREELDILNKDIKSRFNSELYVFSGDLTSSDDLTKFCEEVKKIFPAVGVIINNAGFNTLKTSIETTDINEIDKQFRVHALAPFILYKSFISQMKEASDGLIINILSDQVRDRTRGGWAAYATTKHALYGLGKVMVSEAAENGVKVTNAIIGGMNSTFRKEPRDEYLAPADVAKVILQLLHLPEDIYIPEIVIYPKIYLTK